MEKERVEQTLVFCPSAVNAGGHEERGGRILRFRPDGAATAFPKAVGGPESGVVKRVRRPGAAALLEAQSVAVYTEAKPGRLRPTAQKVLPSVPDTKCALRWTECCQL